MAGRTHRDGIGKSPDRNSYLIPFKCSPELPKRESMNSTFGGATVGSNIEYHNLVEDLQKQNWKLKIKIFLLERTLSKHNCDHDKEADMDMEVLERDMLRKDQMISEAEEKAKGFEQKYLEVRNKYEEMIKDESVSSDYKSLKDRNEELEQAVDSNNARIQDLEHQLDALSKSRKKNKLVIYNLVQKLKQLKGVDIQKSVRLSVEDVSSETELDEKDYKVIKDNMQSNSHILKEMNTALEVTSTNKQALLDSIEEKNSLIKHLQEGLQEMDKMCSMIREELGDTKEKKDRIERTLKLECENLRKQLKLEAREHQEQIKKLSSRDAESVVDKVPVLPKKHVEDRAVQSQVSLSDVSIDPVAIAENHRLRERVDELQVQLEEGNRQKHLISQQQNILQRHLEKLAHFMQQLIDDPSLRNISDDDSLLSQASNCLDETLLLSHGLIQDISSWEQHDVSQSVDISVSRFCNFPVESTRILEQPGDPVTCDADTTQLGTEESIAEGRNNNSALPLVKLAKSREQAGTKQRSSTQHKSSVYLANDNTTCVISAVESDKSGKSTVSHKSKPDHPTGFAVPKSSRTCWGLSDSYLPLSSRQFRGRHSLDPVFSSDSDIWSEPDCNISRQRVGIEMQRPQPSPSKKGCGRAMLNKDSNPEISYSCDANRLRVKRSLGTDGSISRNELLKQNQKLQETVLGQAQMLKYHEDCLQAIQKNTISLTSEVQHLNERLLEEAAANEQLQESFNRAGNDHMCLQMKFQSSEALHQQLQIELEETKQKLQNMLNTCGRFKEEVNVLKAEKSELLVQTESLKDTVQSQAEEIAVLTARTLETDGLLRQAQNLNQQLSNEKQMVMLEQKQGISCEETTDSLLEWVSPGSDDMSEHLQDARSENSMTTLHDQVHYPINPARSEVEKVKFLDPQGSLVCDPDASRANLVMAEERIKSLEKEIHLLQEEVRKKDGANIELNEQLTELGAKTAQWDVWLAKKEREVEENLNTLDQRIGEMESMKDMNLKLIGDISRLERHVSTLEENHQKKLLIIQQLDAQIKNNELVQSDQEVQKEQWMVKINTYENQISTLKSEIARLNKKILDVERQHQEKTRSLEEDNNINELDYLRKENSILKQNCAQSGMNRLELKEKLDEKCSLIDQLTIDKENMKISLEMLKKEPHDELIMMEENFSKLRKECHMKTLVIDELRSEIETGNLVRKDEIMSEMMRYAEELNLTKGKMDSLEKDCCDKSVLIEQMKIEMKGFRSASEIQAAASQKKHLEELNDFRDKVAGLLQDSVCLRENNSELEKLLKEKDHIMDQAQAEYEKAGKLQKECEMHLKEQFFDQICVMRTNLSELENENERLNETLLRLQEDQLRKTCLIDKLAREIETYKAPRISDALKKELHVIEDIDSGQRLFLNVKTDGTSPEESLFNSHRGDGDQIGDESVFNVMDEVRTMQLKKGQQVEKQNLEGPNTVVSVISVSENEKSHLREMTVVQKQCEEMKLSMVRPKNGIASDELTGTAAVLADGSSTVPGSWEYFSKGRDTNVKQNDRSEYQMSMLEPIGDGIAVRNEILMKDDEIALLTDRISLLQSDCDCKTDLIEQLKSEIDTLMQRNVISESGIGQEMKPKEKDSGSGDDGSKSELSALKNELANCKKRHKKELWKKDFYLTTKTMIISQLNAELEEKKEVLLSLPSDSCGNHPVGEGTKEIEYPKHKLATKIDTAVQTSVGKNLQSSFEVVVLKQDLKEKMEMVEELEQQVVLQANALRQVNLDKEIVQSALNDDEYSTVVFRLKNDLQHRSTVIDCQAKKLQKYMDHISVLETELGKSSGLIQTLRENLDLRSDSSAQQDSEATNGKRHNSLSDSTCKNIEAVSLQSVERKLSQNELTLTSSEENAEQTNFISNNNRSKLINATIKAILESENQKRIGLQSVINCLKDELQMITLENKNLEEKLQGGIKEQENLEMHLSKLKDASLLKNSEITMLKLERSKLKSELALSFEDGTKKSQTNAKLDIQVEELQISLDQKQDLITELEADLLNKVNKVDELKYTLENHNCRLHQLESKLNPADDIEILWRTGELDARKECDVISRLEILVEQLKDDLNRRQTTISKLESDLQTKTQQASMLEHSLESREELVNQLQMKLKSKSDLVATHDDIRKKTQAITELEIRQRQLEGTISQLQNIINGLETDLQCKMRQNIQLECDLKNCKESANEFQSKMESQSSHIANLDKELRKRSKANEKERTEKETIIGRIKKELDDRIYDHQVMCAKSEEKEFLLASKESRIKDLRNEISELKSALRSSTLKCQSKGSNADVGSGRKSDQDLETLCHRKRYLEKSLLSLQNKVLKDIPPLFQSNSYVNERVACLCSKKPAVSDLLFDDVPSQKRGFRNSLEADVELLNFLRCFLKYYVAPLLKVKRTKEEVDKIQNRYQSELFSRYKMDENFESTSDVAQMKADSLQSVDIGSIESLHRSDEDVQSASILSAPSYLNSRNRSDGGLAFSKELSQSAPDFLDPAVQRSNYSSPDLGIESDPNQEQGVSKPPTRTHLGTSQDYLHSPKSEMDMTEGQIHAVGALKDFELLKKEIEECIVGMKAISTRACDGIKVFKTHSSPKKMLEFMTLKGILDSCNNIELCLQQVQKIIDGFWCGPYPVDSTALKSLLQEHDRLKQKLMETLNEQKVTREQLEENKRRTERQHQKISKRLVETRKVMKQVKKNVENHVRRESCS